jgi:hypothetical protein
MSGLDSSGLEADADAWHEIETERHGKALSEASLAVKCPICQVPAGKPCRTHPTIGTNLWHVHNERTSFYTKQKKR